MKHSENTNCPSDEVLIKLIDSTSTEDVCIGISFLATKSEEEIAIFIDKYDYYSGNHYGHMNNTKERYLAARESFVIIRGWSYMQVYPVNDSDLEAFPKHIKL